MVFGVGFEGGGGEGDCFLWESTVSGVRNSQFSRLITLITPSRVTTSGFQVLMQQLGFPSSFFFSEELGSLPPA
eukprot:scaffold12953_cov123-Skeletonema_dohrnii-CCMP3373.AAC.13